MIKARPDLPAPPIEGDFEQAIARKLEARGIATVPGLHQDEEPDWITQSRAALERMTEAQRATEAQRQAEQDAAQASQSAASLLAGEILKQADALGTNSMPLNGAAVLRAALAGSPGTVNGGS